jgi:hypothetical protein
MKMETDKQQQRNFNNENSSSLNRARGKSDPLKQDAFINENIAELCCRSVRVKSFTWMSFIYSQKQH